MDIMHDVDLSNYSTMKLGGTGRYLTTVSSRSEVESAYRWAAEQHVTAIVVGGGSNISWRDSGFDGLIIVNQLKGYDDTSDDSLNHFVTVGAGENWDDVVKRTVASGLSGIEALSLIPGTAGATPVQNVGAYGQDISQTLVSVEAYDTAQNLFVTIPADDCGFGYRTSRFKTVDRGRYFITGLTLHLQHVNPEPPYYRAVSDYLEAHGISTVTPDVVRNAVIAIRQSKLPDPETVANNGSFFANPVVDSGTAQRLQKQFPDIPLWPDDNGIKIPAAWLLEQAGFKDYHDARTGMGTWPSQPLVLVNEQARNASDLEAFRNELIDGVSEKFGIRLEQEPELLPYATLV